MRSQKGITMTSLVIYIIAFAVIITIVGSITYFFNANAKDINMSTNISSEYNKFNLYMIDQTKGGKVVKSYLDDGSSDRYITFSKDGANNTFVLLPANNEEDNKILYFNKTKLCENVRDFKLEIDDQTASNGKSILKTYIDINGTVYTTDYVLE